MRFDNYKKSPLKKMALCLFLLTIILAGFSFLNSEIRSFIYFKVFPTQARNAHFIKMSNDMGAEIFLLGTIHNDHMIEKDYSFPHLAAVIENLSPTTLLIESRQGELERGNLGDGPCEMPFVYLIAKKLEIPVYGIDWWEKSKSLGSSNQEREDRIFSNIQKHTGSAGKYLVLLGFSHIEEMVSRLESVGFTRQNIANKGEFFKLHSEQFLFPKGMSHVISHRIENEARSMLESDAMPYREKIENLIEQRKRFLTYIENTGEEL